MLGSRHCKRLQCLCTHEDPCYSGWVTYNYVEEIKRIRNGIPAVEYINREGARPCMTCNPQGYEFWFSSKSNEEYHSRMQDQSHSNKSKAYERDERDKTRTL